MEHGRVLRDVQGRRLGHGVLRRVGVAADRAARRCRNPTSAARRGPGGGPPPDVAVRAPLTARRAPDSVAARSGRARSDGSSGCPRSGCPAGFPTAHPVGTQSACCRHAATPTGRPQYPRPIVTAQDLPSSGVRRSKRATAPAAVTGSMPARRAARSRVVPPVLVRQIRNGIEESVHRGDIVEVDVDGRLIRGLGDPDRVVDAPELRQAVRRGRAARGRRDRGVRPRAGRDRDHGQLPLRRGPPRPDDPGHVPAGRRVARRSSRPASRACRSTRSRRCGSRATASSPARSGTCAPASTPCRSCCRGSAAGTRPTTGARITRRRSRTGRSSPGRSARRRTSCGPAIDGCGVLTYAFPLREVARAYAMLADPAAVGASDPRASVAPALTVVRDAMLAHPEMVGGTRDRLDTSLMKALPGRVVSKARDGGAARAGDPARDADVGGAVGRDRDGGQDRGRRRLRPGDMGGIDRGARPGRRASTATRSASSADTTGRRSSTRTGGSAPRRSPSFELAPLGELVGAG